MPILISGATGFIGSTITRHLLGAGHSVRAMSRSASGARDMLGASDEGRAALAEERLTFVEADVTQPETLDGAVWGTEAVIQAAQFPGAPVEDPKRGLTYMDVDRDGTINLLKAVMRVHEVPTGSSGATRLPAASPHFFYMSGITVAPGSDKPWDQAKWEAEEAIRGSGLRWTVVRPSWVYGPDDVSLNRLLGYSRYLPFLPIFGKGEDVLAPLLVEDIGEFYVHAFTRPEACADTTFVLGGPDRVTLDEFLRIALRTRSRKRPILHIPKAVGKIQGAVMQHLPGRPLSPDAVDFVAQGGAPTEADRRRLAERLPEFRTTPLREGLKYLEVAD